MDAAYAGTADAEIVWRRVTGGLNLRQIKAGPRSAGRVDVWLQIASAVASSRATYDISATVDNYFRPRASAPYYGQRRNSRANLSEVICPHLNICPTQFGRDAKFR
jgi:hypothetical protein